MAGKKNRFSSVRIYRRYSFGAFLTGLCSLGIAGVFAVFALMPFMSFTQGDEVVARTGLEFIYFGIRDFAPSLYDHKLDGFLEAFNFYLESDANNQLLAIISSIHTYIEYALIGVLAVSVLFAAIVAILGLFWILAGRIHHPKATLNLSIVVLVFYAIFIGLTYLYLFFYGEIIKALETEVSTSLNLLPVIMIAALLGLVIIMGITHAAAFKNRVFASKKKYQNGLNESYLETDNGQIVSPATQVGPNYPQNSGNYVYVEQPVYVSRPPVSNTKAVEVPPDIKEIGVHAFSKNVHLKTADIPNGITTIGDGAFSNCINLESVTIPLSVRYIGYNAFFHTPKLKKIVYLGSTNDWNTIHKGSNWNRRSALTMIVTNDGKLVARRPNNKNAVNKKK